MRSRAIRRFSATATSRCCAPSCRSRSSRRRSASAAAMMRACEVRRSTTRALSSCSRLVVSSALRQRGVHAGERARQPHAIGSSNEPGGHERQCRRDAVAQADERREDQRERRAEQHGERDQIERARAGSGPSGRRGPSRSPSRRCARAAARTSASRCCGAVRRAAAGCRAAARPASARSAPSSARSPSSARAAGPSVRIATPRPTDRPDRGSRRVEDAQRQRQQQVDDPPP